MNTWYFRGDGVGTFPAVADNIQAVMQAFYFGAAANGSAISNWISGEVVSGAEVRCYELIEAPPRTPEIRPLTLGGMYSGVALPTEVAMVLSYRTTRKGPRGRGRLYLGPLGQNATIMVSGKPQITNLLRDTVIDRAADVLGTTENVTWVGLSRMDGQTYEVTGGYVDDAYDTQRRRGMAPTGRWPFGAYVAPA